MIKICEFCGAEYKSTHKKSKYCSRKCSSQSHKREVKCICKHCGVEFVVQPNQIKIGGGKFCSRDCMNASRTLKVKRICKKCGKEFYTFKSLLKKSKNAGSYCSRKCANNEPRKEHLKCDYCGSDIYKIKSQINDFNFCNYKCLHSWRSENLRGERANNWKGGIAFAPYCEKFNNEFKERVRAFFDNKCVLCGLNQSENKRNKLHVHHVHYDKSSCCSDAPRMFVALCNSCHSKTNYNREYWQNLFESIIIDIYNGKSYYTIEEFNRLK